MQAEESKSETMDTLVDDFRTAMTLQVPGGSTGRLSDSDMGDSDSSSCRGGSERGHYSVPKISIMSLGDDIAATNENRTAHGSSANTMSMDGDGSSRARSASEMSVGRSEGAPGIVIGVLGDEDEEKKVS